MENNIDKMIIACADKNYSSFKQELEPVIQTKMSDMLDLVAKEKANSIFQKQ